MRALFILICLLGTLSCSKGADDGTRPHAVKEQLPALKLTDATPDLLLTWLDDRGGTHSAVAIAEVPKEGRKAVRVITKTGGHGALFYVADLTAKQADGSYRVRTMPRTQWESMIEKRRDAYRAKHAPPPVASSAEKNQPPIAGLKAIVYGADWCRPCHQATAYLKKRGVPVVEYDIDNDAGRAREMRRKLKRIGKPRGSIPVIDINGQILVGFNPRALTKAIRRARGGGTAL